MLFKRNLTLLNGILTTTEMEYVTHEDFTQAVGEKSLVQLTDGNGQVDVDVVEFVNTEAVAEINGYLRGVYSLPLTEPIDASIKSITVAIMKYLLYKRRDERSVPDSVIKMYQLTTAKLKDIQARKFVLEAAPAGLGVGSVSKQAVAYWSPTAKFPNNFTKHFD